MNLTSDIIELLKKAEKFSGLFLLVSNSKEYIQESARNFIFSLLDMTPEQRSLDFKEFSSFENAISVQTINALIDFEMKKAVSSKSKGIILNDVELLKDQASDKLLKTIEEHNDDSLIVFTTTNISMVSPTIRSRSIVLYDFTDNTEFFVKTKSKFLGFLVDVRDSEFSELPKFITNAMNLGIFNIICALFINAVSKEHVDLAKDLLRLYLSPTKEDILCQYLVYRVFSEGIMI